MKKNLKERLVKYCDKQKLDTDKEGISEVKYIQGNYQECNTERKSRWKI